MDFDDPITKPKTGGSFGFGDWGSSWGKGDSSWGFMGGGTSTNKDAQDTSADAGDGGIWSTGPGKKKDKKNISNTFDFGGYNALDEGAEENNDGGKDDLAGFATATGKDKKKKKGTYDDFLTETEATNIGTAIGDTNAAQDTWSGWGAGSAIKDKKNKKNEIGETPPVPPPPPTTAHTEDEWGVFGGKKGKKGKKGAVEEVKEEPAVVVVPEIVAEPEADAGSGWGAFGKKDKKKGKKGAAEEATEEPIVVVPDLETAPEPEADMGWSFGTKKKDKKGKKIVPEEKEEEKPIKDTTADTWDFGSLDRKDKDKPRKGDKDETEKKETDPEPVADEGWGVFGSKKKGKKGKKDDMASSKTEDDMNVISVPNVPPPPPVDDFASTWAPTGKKGKKGKKDPILEVADDPVPVVEAAAAEEKNEEDEFLSWATTDPKAKKSKRGAAADKKQDLLPSVPPPPPVPEVPNAIWDAVSVTSSKKVKEKKGDKGKKAEIESVPEPEIMAEPEEEEQDPFEDDLDTWNLSPKERKKKEKEREKAKKAKEAEDKAAAEAKESEEQEKAEKEAREKKAEKKTGKKGKTASFAEKSADKPALQDLMQDSVPDTVAPVIEEDIWGSGWGTSTKKKKGKETKPDVPPPVPTPPAQGLTPPPEDLAEDDWGSFAPVSTGKGKKDAKSLKAIKVEEAKATKKGAKGKLDEDPTKDEAKEKEPSKEKSTANAEKHSWAGMGTTSTSKSKSAKDKVKDKDKDKTANQAATDALIDFDDPDEIVDIIEDPPIKKASKFKDGKISKKATKEAEKSKTTEGPPKGSELDDLLSSWGDPLASPNDESQQVMDGNDDNAKDAWSFWGSSKKTSGNKADEAKKEITKNDSANQKAPAKSNLKKGPEESKSSKTADEPIASKDGKDKILKGEMSSTVKSSSKTSSVLQRVKALEKTNATKDSEDIAEVSPLADPDLASLTNTESKKEKSGSKSKAAASAAKSNKKKVDLPVAEEKASKDSIPGGFPEDDIVEVIDLGPDTKKSSKKTSKPKKTEKAALKDEDLEMEDLLVDAPAPNAPPTPPPEPAAKPAKKERTKVVRDKGGSSWAFWGAADKAGDAKKDTKSKDDADVVSKTKAAPGLSRSKSTKTAKEKDKETDKASKSSASDEKDKKTDRPAKSRTSTGLGGLFGAPPPRTKTVRRSTTDKSSRRQSMPITDTGLPSPPPEEGMGDAPEMNIKAAKLMGMDPGKSKKKASLGGKQKSKGMPLSGVPIQSRARAKSSSPAAPDPYPIDDDDMVMVGGFNDDQAEGDGVAANPPAEKSKKSSKKSKEVTKPIDPEENDIVMVDADPTVDDARPETIQFDETPPRPLKRSSTIPTKKTSDSQSKSIGGLFGFGKKPRRPSGATADRPKSVGRGLTDDEGITSSRRKRAAPGSEDAAKRLRREERKVRRSGSGKAAETADDGFITEADGGVPVPNVEEEAAAAEARRDERRRKRAERDAAAREAEIKDAEERRARRKADEKTKIREAKERKRREDEREARKEEERRQKRKDREEMNAKIEASQRRRHTADFGGATTDNERPGKRSERRKSYMPTTTTAAERPKSSRRKSTVPATTTDYFAADEAKGGNYVYPQHGNDPTSSWVKSQISDPPAPPPVDPTVIDGPPETLAADGSRDTARDLEDEAATRKAMRRKTKRQSTYIAEGGTGDGDRERRRRNRDSGAAGGGGSDSAGEQAQASRRLRRSNTTGGYQDLKSYGERPSLGAAGKRGSWLKRVAGL